MDSQGVYRQLRMLIRVGYVLLFFMAVETLVNVLRGDVFNTFLAVMGAAVAHYALRYNQDRLERERQDAA